MLIYIIIKGRLVFLTFCAEYEVVSSTKGPNGEEVSVLTTNQTHTAVENLKPESRLETNSLRAKHFFVWLWTNDIEQISCFAEIIFNVLQSI